LRLAVGCWRGLRSTGTLAYKLATTTDHKVIGIMYHVASSMRGMTAVDASSCGRLAQVPDGSYSSVRPRHRMNRGGHGPGGAISPRSGLARRCQAMTDRDGSAPRDRLGAVVGMLVRRFEDAIYGIAFLLLAAAAVLVVIGTFGAVIQVVTRQVSTLEGGVLVLERTLLTLIIAELAYTCVPTS
jgi:hypothetical protein